MTQTSLTPPLNRLDDKEAPNALKTLASIVYILQILALATAGITLVFTALINLMKKSETEGTWLESHFEWQLETALYAIIACVIGAATSMAFTLQKKSFT